MPRPDARRPALRRLPPAGRPPVGRWAGVVSCAVLLAGCGAPPRPLPTAPPPAPDGSAAGSGMPSALPTLPSLPAGGLPATLPTYPVPTLPTLPTVPTTIRPTTTRPAPSPAPRCTGGPTHQQVLDLVNGKPGIPDADLVVKQGPFCASSWQFTILGIAGQSDDDVEPLLVVSTGRPAGLRLVEAGTDVCTDRVEDDAPAGIRVRACGA